jgi:hypothetical protein
LFPAQTFWYNDAVGTPIVLNLNCNDFGVALPTLPKPAPFNLNEDEKYVLLSK